MVRMRNIVLRSTCNAPNRRDSLAAIGHEWRGGPLHVDRVRRPRHVVGIGNHDLIPHAIAQAKKVALL